MHRRCSPHRRAPLLPHNSCIAQLCPLPSRPCRTPSTASPERGLLPRVVVLRAPQRVRHVLTTDRASPPAPGCPRRCRWFSSPLTCLPAGAAVAPTAFRPQFSVSKRKAEPRVFVRYTPSHRGSLSSRVSAFRSRRHGRTHTGRRDKTIAKAACTFDPCFLPRGLLAPSSPNNLSSGTFSHASYVKLVAHGACSGFLMTCGSPGVFVHTVFLARSSLVEDLSG